MGDFIVDCQIANPFSSLVNAHISLFKIGQIGGDGAARSVRR